MNILDALENYKISLVNNKEALDILSLISYKGSLNDEELKDILIDVSPTSKVILLDLFRSNLIKKNIDNDWFISFIGNLALSKFGISQLSSSYILKKHVNDEASKWLSDAVKTENNINSAAQIYTKFIVGDHFINNLSKNLDEDDKNIVFYFLYFSSKDDFYTLDKKSFYKLNSTKETNKSLSYVLNSFDTCHMQFNDINKNLICNDNKFYRDNIFTGNDSKINSAGLLVNLIRLVSFVISNRFDFGFSSINSLMKDKNELWDKLDIEEMELKFIYKTCLRKYTDNNVFDDLNVLLKKVSKQDSISNSSINQMKYLNEDNGKDV